MPTLKPAVAFQEVDSQDTIKLRAHKPLPRSKSVKTNSPGAKISQHTKITTDENAAINLQSEADGTVPPALGESPSGLPPTPPSNLRDTAPYGESRQLSLGDGTAASIKSQKSYLSTPSNQRSPPTPDITPPGTMESLDRRRSPALRYPSSRAESFTTAKEHQLSSDDEDGRHFLPLNATPTKSFPRIDGRGGDADALRSFSAEGELTPTAHRVGKGAQRGERVLSQQNQGRIPGPERSKIPARNVTVRKRPQDPQNKLPAAKDDVPESPVLPPFPRVDLHLRERFGANSETPRTTSMERFAQDIGWPSEVNDRLQRHLRDPEAKRLSGISTASTVVEAVVVPTPPRRSRTLRHVSKVTSLRGSSDSAIAMRAHRESSGSQDVRPHRLRHIERRLPDRRNRDSAGSDFSSLMESPARVSNPQHVAETVPVVVIPKRSSSLSATARVPVTARAHSLTRAHQGRPSTAPDVTSVTLSSPPERSLSFSEDHVRSTTLPKTLRPRRSFDKSASTEDKPLSIAEVDRVPGKASASISGSQEAHTSSQDGLRSLLAPMQGPAEQAAIHEEPKSTPLPVPSEKPDQSPPNGFIVSKLATARPVSVISPSGVSTDDHSQADSIHLSPIGRRFSEQRPAFERSSSRTTDEGRRMSIDRSTTREEHAMARHLFSQNTPYSQFSDTPDALEVSEATAVSIYPHNNHSLLVVQQVARPGVRRSINTTSPPAEAPQPMLTIMPSTPPMHFAPTAAVDSPLKNPRKPPEPPALKIIPPTPAEELERELAPTNQTRDGSTPSRRASLAQKARRYSDTLIQPLLSRTNGSIRRSQQQPVHRTPSVGEQQDNKLHPFWRPRGFWDDFSDSDEDSIFFEGRRSKNTGDSDREVEPGHAVTASTRPAGGFLIGNTLGVSRAGTNVRRHHVSLPAALLARHRHPREKGVIMRHSASSLRSSGTWDSRGARAMKSREPGLYNIPGLGLQFQYIGLRGVREKFREHQFKQEEKRREVKRNELRRKIGTRFVVDAGRVM